MGSVRICKTYRICKAPPQGYKHSKNIWGKRLCPARLSKGDSHELRCLYLKNWLRHTASQGSRLHESSKTHHAGVGLSVVMQLYLSHPVSTTNFSPTLLEATSTNTPRCKHQQTSTNNVVHHVGLQCNCYFCFILWGELTCFPIKCHVKLVYLLLTVEMVGN